MKNQKVLAVLTLLSLGASSLMPAAMAHSNRYYDNNGRYQAYGRYQPSYWQQHPYVKKAAIGGGAGAVLGAVLSQEGSRGDGAIKGALLGAGAGLGYEYLKRKGYLGSRY
ncbi:MAG: hypothetical protein K0Q50_1223 [Vampirovibrio sp.]|nr:hypothetical protein [Vampirovibrio sp.]